MAIDAYDPKRGCDWDETDLSPLETTVEEHRARVPAWLERAASKRALSRTPFHQMIVRQLGTEVLTDFPLFVPEIRTGYILDFLLPHYGVSIDIGDPEPDDPEAIYDLFARDNDLMAYEGILTLRFPPERVRDLPHRVLHEIREAVGLGAVVPDG